ncbi:serine/threonine-protein kinase [Streptomyces gobiensis]|uniref:serine/threonine-protein kinase n=1 Tax=Streptomyces gobiensis TaxID=2875706 RepID=UPI001E5F123A|nr:serine/threonine-protein kinase [Streptomyces gobiensis]UGY94706.1 serine/threonine protein kinase [Streptomyces gobiensis]
MATTGKHGPEDSGRLLAGRYRVVGQLGRGGMGVVCRAVDEVLGREVAVKELRTFSNATGPELADRQRRMQREARAAARVRHPGVIAVHDVTEHEGRPVIVMELVDGPSLDDVLRQRGALGPAEAVAIGAKVLDALAAAHRAGVLHRDVKPGNILLEDGGRVVLTDFGIATMEETSDSPDTRLTRSGELVGSLDYLAPERARGEEPGPASDVWALGATLYAAVEGVSPFRRTSTWSTLNAIVVEPLPEPRRAGALGPVLRELMHKDPARRPDAERAAALLAAVVAEDAPGNATLRTGRRAPAAAVPYEPTVRDAGGRPPQGAFGPPVPPPVPPPGQDAGRGSIPARPAGRRSKVLVAAAVAAVLLVGAGVTYAVVGRTGGDGRTEAAAGSSSTDEESSAPKGRPEGGTGTADRPDRPTTSPVEDLTSPSQVPAVAAGSTSGEDNSGGGGDDGGDGSDGDTGGESGDTAGGSNGSGGSSGSDSGGTTTSGGSGGGSSGGSSPKPSCTAIGGGKYNCEVWRTADSYDAAHQKAGTLYAGTNYFYCQKKLSYRETYGEWTNVWWARTDDDSGNQNVYVSDVYIKGGDNDAPVPGLPVC